MIADAEKSQMITLSFFYRDNNPDCQITRLALYNVLTDYLDRIVLQEINFDLNKDICYYYKVYGVPTILIHKNKNILNRYSGILNSNELLTFLNPVMKNMQNT
jgi:hypothetical protein